MIGLENMQTCGDFWGIVYTCDCWKSYSYPDSARVMLWTWYFTEMQWKRVTQNYPEDSKLNFKGLSYPTCVHSKTVQTMVFPRTPIMTWKNKVVDLHGAIDHVSRGAAKQCVTRISAAALKSCIESSVSRYVSMSIALSFAPATLWTCRPSSGLAPCQFEWVSKCFNLYKCIWGHYMAHHVAPP